jgi:hypothetical protein
MSSFLVATLAIFAHPAPFGIRPSVKKRSTRGVGEALDRHHAATYLDIVYRIKVSTTTSRRSQRKQAPPSSARGRERLPTSCRRGVEPAGAAEVGTFSSVALLGTPSLNSSVPRRVWTVSGVVIAGGMAAACAEAKWGSARTAQVARTARPMMSHILLAPLVTTGRVSSKRRLSSKRRWLGA